MGEGNNLFVIRVKPDERFNGFRRSNKLGSTFHQIVLGAHSTPVHVRASVLTFDPPAFSCCGPLTIHFCQEGQTQIRAGG